MSDTKTQDSEKLKEIFAGRAEEGKKEQPSIEQIREEFMKMLETPIEDGEKQKASEQLLLCDIQIAELEQAVAGLKSQIAANEAEIAKHHLAKAIITRRLANA